MSQNSGEEHDSTAVGTAPGDATWPPDLSSESLRPDTVIGNYRLVEQVGAGGMGVVYRAEQLRPVKRTVALKLIKLGMDTRDVVARFETERQALAILEHPGVARVYDAGATPTGRPYFVMEYVPGVPITEYCDARQLTTAQRLELFEQVCHAVQHAHYKGVLHRDLKPSNILVTETDGRAQPKVIDFGVAKAVSERGATDALATRAGQLVGTPAYMSPEQAAGAAVDTRADVYSLGLVLYELLAGALPFARVEQAHRSEVEAPKPSARLSTLGADVTTIAARRATDSTRLLRLVRGDLDVIVMKAIDRDPARRYGTAEALAEDVRRHRMHEPIAARPPTLAYQARKFARRNRVLVTAALVAALGLAAGSVLSTWQAVRATRAQRLAQETARRERAINTFLNDVFKSVNPRFLAADGELGSGGGAGDGAARPMSVQDLLASAIRRLDENYAPDPAVEAPLRVTIGQALRGLGYEQLAEAQLRRGYELSRAALGETSPETLRAAGALLTVLMRSPRKAEAEPLAKYVLEAYRAAHGPADRRTVTAAHAYAAAVHAAGRRDEAERLVRQCLIDHEKYLGPDDPQTLSVVANLANILLQRDDLAGAEPLYRRSYEASVRQLGPDHAITLGQQVILAGVVQRRGDVAASERLYSDALARLERVAPDSMHAQAAREALATLRRAAGDLAGAELLERRRYDVHRRTRGDADLQLTIPAGIDWAGILTQLNRFDEAEAALRGMIETVRAAAPDSPVLTDLRRHAIGVLVARGELADAESAARAILAEPPVDDDAAHRTARLLVSDQLVDVLEAQSRVDEALALNRELIAQCAERAAEDPGALWVRQARQADVFWRAARHDDALRAAAEASAYWDELAPHGRQWREATWKRIDLNAALQRWDDAAACFPALIARAEASPLWDDEPAQHRSNWGYYLTKAGRYAEAETPLLAAYRERAQKLGAEHGSTRDTAKRLAELYEAWGKSDEAARYRALGSATTSPSTAPS